MNQANWQKIYLDYSPKLLGICRRYIADLQTAEDLLQDSFIIAMQKSHQLNDEKAMFGWLKTIVVNNALQYLRNSAKEIFVATDISEIPESLTEMNTSATEKNHVLAYDFTREQLLMSIDSLPAHHRSVFNLFCIENNSHQEIAKLLGINVNTSKSHLLRAKKSIQNYLLSNFVNHDTPKSKNKVTQLLVFLGLGGLLWAQTFQSKFSDFSISSNRQLSIPNNMQLNGVQSSGSGNNLQNKLIITATLLITLIISVIVNRENKPSKQKFSSAESSVKMVKENDFSNDFATTVYPENTEKTKISNEKTDEIILNKPLENHKTVYQEKLLKEKTVSSKDSADSNSRKVVVVKKIIQRDTIFIEREN